MPVGEADRRMALLEKVFRGDWEGAAPRNQSATRYHLFCHSCMYVTSTPRGLVNRTMSKDLTEFSEGLGLGKP
eukprot:scaffold311108_cov38-Prasinocladus_malaysianus.AAC.1